MTHRLTDRQDRRTDERATRALAYMSRVKSSKDFTGTVMH